MESGGDCGGDDGGGDGGGDGDACRSTEARRLRCRAGECVLTYQDTKHRMQSVPVDRDIAEEAMKRQRLRREAADSSV
jgi:hypothetical protein